MNYQGNSFQSSYTSNIPLNFNYLQYPITPYCSNFKQNSFPVIQSNLSFSQQPYNVNNHSFHPVNQTSNERNVNYSQYDNNYQNDREFQSNNISLIQQNINNSLFPNIQTNNITYSIGNDVIHPIINSNSISNMIQQNNTLSNNYSNLDYYTNNNNENLLNFEYSTPAEMNHNQNINKNLTQISENPNNLNNIINVNSTDTNEENSNNYFAKIKNVNRNRKLNLFSIP